MNLINKKLKYKQDHQKLVFFLILLKVGYFLYSKPPFVFIKDPNFLIEINKQTEGIKVQNNLNLKMHNIQLLTH